MWKGGKVTSMPEFKVVKPDQFKYAVGSILEEYSDEVAKAMYVATDETCDEVVDALKTSGTFKGKKYRRGWKKFIQQKMSGTIEAKVWNKNHYRLTHLLEFGHQLRLGGRHVGDVKAFEHIKPVNDQVPEIFQRKFTSLMGGK